MRLTQKLITSLTVPAGKSEVLVFDDDLPGFGVRILSSGTKSFLAQYRTAAGQRRQRIGRFPLMSLDQARLIARGILLDAHIGHDPAAQRVKAKEEARLTLEVAADRFLARKRGELRGRSYQEIARHIERHWAPLHRRPLAVIERSEIAERLEEIARDSGAVAANRARAALSSLFSWAMSAGLAGANPVVGVMRPLKKEIARDHVLTPEELRSVWSAAGEFDYGRIVRLLILLGVRRDECGGMRWSELSLDGEHPRWVIPAERMKGKEEHLVPLPSQAVAILKEAPRRAGTDFVFGSVGTGFSGWSKSKRRMDARIAAAGNVVRDFRLHDLRRTAASGLARLGAPPHIVDVILAHKIGGKVTRTYNRYSYEVEKREALSKWADYVERLLSPDENIVLFPEAVRA